MSEQDTVDLDTSNQAADDTSVSDTDNNDNTDDSADDSNDVEALKQLNKKLFARAKEAEGFKLVDGKWIKKPQAKPLPATPEAQATGELSARDIILLSSSGIKESEDLDEIIDFAKFKKLSIAEALKNNTLKAILAEKSEQRKTAEATNTGGSRRVTQKESDDTLLEKASKGQIPTSDDGINRLIAARLNKRKNG